MHRWLALSAIAAAPAFFPQDSGDERYPPERHAAVVRYYVLQGDVDEERLDAALEKLDDPDALILFGPQAAPTRPKDHFVALEAGAGLEPKQLSRALKRSGGKPEELAWLVVRWNQTELPRRGRGGGGGARGGGGGLRRQILSMSGDLRWVALGGEQILFYYVPGKLDAKGIQKRFEKLFTRFGIDGDELGLEVVHDEIEWQLEGEIDAAAAKQAERAIGKLKGVTHAAIDPVSGRLRVSVRLEGLTTSGPPTQLGDGGRTGDGTGRPLFDTNPIVDALEKYALVLAAPEEEEAGGAAGRPARGEGFR